MATASRARSRVTRGGGFGRRGSRLSGSDRRSAPGELDGAGVSPLGEAPGEADGPRGLGEAGGERAGAGGDLDVDDLVAGGLELELDRPRAGGGVLAGAGGGGDERRELDLGAVGAAPH